MRTQLKQTFLGLSEGLPFASLRFVHEKNEIITVRDGVLEPVQTSEDRGVMLTVVYKGGMGYAATNDLSPSGLRGALARATTWAEYSHGKVVTDFSKVAFPHEKGEYITPVEIPWASVPLKEKVDIATREAERLKIDDRIVDWTVSLWHAETEQLFLTNQGGETYQKLYRLAPEVMATANQGDETQTRSLGGRGAVRQGGMEILEQTTFRECAPRIAEEALQLLAAPNCPTGTMHVLLNPDQMILQIHESIGHALEIDRILGDERNYAGRSFVKLEDFGSLRYGTDLLNITFDPTQTNEFATYAFDDDGMKAEKTFIIEKGILKRGLGSFISEARAGVPGVANSRATSWNRPPIDRMANLNLEPGTSTLDEMIADVEDGIYMKTNVSWSIDDSRNKFQFGCEWGQRIENGNLTTVVKNPNYRGISVPFWNRLKKVGEPSRFDLLGTPYCGKGEPNQTIRVGHASPPCLFSAIEVFGGA